MRFKRKCTRFYTIPFGIMRVTGFSVTVKKTINLVSKILLILYIYKYIYNIRYNSGQRNGRKSNCNTATA